MEKKIQELKVKFRTAKGKKALAEIDSEMEALAATNPAEFEKGMLAAIQATNKEAEDEILRDKLEEILPAISVSYLATHYFQKTPQWFYQRLNGNIVNGKPAKFTKEELQTLSGALCDISTKITQSVAFVV